QAGDLAAEAYFPAALGETPPLAADARRSADGRRGALLKLVAGLLGTGLDELIQRDARRRQRRLVAGITVTAVIALSMAVLAAFALSAREDAKRRLSQSEDLIGFMIDDLRGQLAPLGQVAVLKSVGDQALEYFESLEDADLTEAALLRKSRALYQIGEVYFELGEFQQAQVSFGLSLEQARVLAAADPDSSARLFELSQAEFWAGYAAWYARDLEQAEQHLQAYHQAAWALHSREPDNPDWVMETFWAANNLGSLAFGRQRYEVALGYFQEAVARIELLLGQEATLERRFEKTAVQSWLGSTYYHLGDLGQSSTAFQSALAEPLDNENALHREERAYFHGKLAAVELHRGRLDAARTHAIAAVEAATALSQADPDSMELLYTRSAQDLQLARVDLYEGKPVDVSTLTEAVARLMTADTPPPKWQALAIDVAELRIRTDAGITEDWKELLQSRNISEHFGRQLSFAISLAEKTNADPGEIRELLATAEAQYDMSKDFDLVLPLLRCYRGLGDSAGVSNMSAVLEAAGSQHPDFIGGAAAIQP
ncbi:MAG: hypothetical protein HKO85_00485, partial [Xanthomonadales bacterium]|nr:hypothetical protein [Xanthomonadales bacterium]